FERFPVFAEIEQQEYQKDLVKYRNDVCVEIPPREREKGVFIDGVGDRPGAVPEHGVEPFSNDYLIKKRRVRDKKDEQRKPAEPVEQERTNCVFGDRGDTENGRQGEVECNTRRNAAHNAEAAKNPVTQIVIYVRSPPGKPRIKGGHDRAS